MSKPTWWNAFGYSTTSAFLFGFGNTSGKVVSDFERMKGDSLRQKERS